MIMNYAQEEKQYVKILISSKSDELLPELANFRVFVEEVFKLLLLFLTLLHPFLIVHVGVGSLPNGISGK